MKSKAQVVIIAVDREPPANLREALLVLAFDSVVTTSVVQARKIANSSPNSLLMVFFGEQRDGGFLCCKELLTCSDVHTKPLLLVGEGASELTSKLERIFGLVQASSHFRNARVIADEVARCWARFQDAQFAKLQKTEEALDDASRPAGEAEPQAPAPNPFTGFKSLPAAFFAEIERLGILRTVVGGAFYSRHVRSKAFVEFLGQQSGDLYRPSGKIMRGADSAVVGHTARVAYITHCLLSAVDVGTDRVRIGTRAALLHAASFKSKRRLASGEYFTAEHPGARAKMAKYIRESATTVSFELGLPEESTVLAFFARLISDEEVSRDKPHFQCASALIAADILDRTSWASGYFNPQRAYNVLKLCKQGAFLTLHPAIVAALIKLTSEAIVVAPAKFSMPRAFLERYRERQRSGEAHSDRPQSGEKRVPIDKLSPGMRLRKPLKTFDGREVLEADAKLDEDLIWRIWQLAAVRPMEHAIVVAVKPQAPIKDPKLLSVGPIEVG